MRVCGVALAFSALEVASGDAAALDLQVTICRQSYQGDQVISRQVDG
jgi:hypothetical protein